MNAGDIAICSRGEIGLITSPFKSKVMYKVCDHCRLYSARENHGELVHVMACTCETGFAWTGIHLRGSKIGQPWSSRDPRKVGTIDALLAESNVYQSILSGSKLDHLPEGSH